MSQRKRLGLVARALGAVTLVALASGCYAETGAEPAYVEASAPVDIRVAPHCDYEGRTVYYVNDHWYARDRGQWVYYRTEPQALVARRSRPAGRPITDITDERIAEERPAN